MNIIDTVKDILKKYSRINEFSDDVQIDFTDNENANIGLFCNGDILIKKDLLGNQKRKMTFNLYAVNQAMNNFERLNNSSFLLELGYYLDSIHDVDITAVVNKTEKKGILTKLNCSNAMLYSRMDGDLNNNVMYQIQISAEYVLNDEEE